MRVRSVAFLRKNLRCCLCVVEGPVAMVTALLCNVERNALGGHMGLRIGLLLLQLEQHLTSPGPGRAHFHNNRNLHI